MKAKRLIIIISIIILFYQISALCLEMDKNNEKLIIVSKSTDYNKNNKVDIDKRIDFHNKKYLGLGRYGFIKKISIDKKSLVEIDFFGQGYASKTVYGIYYDATLLSPIESRKNINHLIEDIAMEHGFEISGKNSESEIALSLDPGQYYFSMYTINPFDLKKYNYKCHIRDDNPKNDLKYNQTIYYDVNESEQVNSFNASIKEGTTEFVLGYDCKEITVFNRKKEIVGSTVFANDNNNDKTININIPRDEDCSIVIKHYDRTYSEEPMKITMKHADSNND